MNGVNSSQKERGVSKLQATDLDFDSQKNLDYTIKMKANEYPGKEVITKSQDDIHREQFISDYFPFFWGGGRGAFSDWQMRKQSQKTPYLNVRKASDNSQKIQMQIRNLKSDGFRSSYMVGTQEEVLPVYCQICRTIFCPLLSNIFLVCLPN